MLCSCGKKTKGLKPLCYKCNLIAKKGIDFATAKVARLKVVRTARHNRNRWRKSFNTCRGCGEDPYCYCGDGTPYSY